MVQNKIYIHCGVQGENTEFNKNLYWPVLQAVPISFTWPDNNEKKYSLLFTSKIAAKIFYDEFSKRCSLLKAKQCVDKNTSFSHLPIPNLTGRSSGVFLDSQVTRETIDTEYNKNCQHICAVGKSTAEYVEKELVPTLFSSENKRVLFPKKEGLRNILTNIDFAPKSSVFIFTALNGKSAETIDSLSSLNLEFHCKIIPIYKLDLFQSEFLSELFSHYPVSKIKSQNINFIFCCRSGKVLEAALSQLQSFFSCDEPRDLPLFLSFSIEKESTKRTLQEHNLIDRISS